MRTSIGDSVGSRLFVLKFTDPTLVLLALPLTRLLDRAIKNFSKLLQSSLQHLVSGIHLKVFDIDLSLIFDVLLGRRK